MNLKRLARVGLAVTVGLGAAFLGPSEALADGQACTTLWTQDPSPAGGKVEVCKTWYGPYNGTYYGEVWGTAYDTDPDGRSAYVRLRCDDLVVPVAQADGASNPEYFAYEFEGCAKVNVRIGLINTSNGEITYWSPWW